MRFIHGKKVSLLPQSCLLLISPPSLSDRVHSTDSERLQRSSASLRFRLLDGASRRIVEEFATCSEESLGSTTTAHLPYDCHPSAHWPMFSPRRLATLFTHNSQLIYWARFRHDLSWGSRFSVSDGARACISLKTFSSKSLGSFIDYLGATTCHISFFRFRFVTHFLCTIRTSSNT